MTLSLIDLIRAGLVTPAPGQGFRNYVAGSPVTGTKMTDYVIGTMTVSGQLIDTFQPQFDQIPNNYTSTITADFTVVGSKFPSIRLAQPDGIRSGWYFYAQDLDPQSSQQPQFTINTVTWGAGSATINFTLNGPYDSDTFKTVSSVSAIVNPGSTVGYEDVSFQVQYAAVNPFPTGFVDANLFFSYTPDAGPFNTYKLVGPYERRILKQSYPAGNDMYDHNYYDTASINPNVTPDAPQASSSYDELAPGQSYTVYMWYRLKAVWGGTGTWLPFTVPPGGSVPTAITYQNGL